MMSQNIHATQNWVEDSAIIKAGAVQTREDGTRLNTELEDLRGLIGGLKFSLNENGILTISTEGE